MSEFGFGGDGGEAAEMAFDVAADVVPDIVPDVVPDIVPDIEPDIVPDVEPDVVRDIEPDIVPDVEPDIVPDIEPDNMPDVEPDIVPDIVPDIEPDIVPDVEPDVVPDIEPDIMPDVAPDVVPDIEPDIMPDVEPDIVPDIEPDVEPDVVPDVEPETGPLRFGELEPNRDYETNDFLYETDDSGRVEYVSGKLELGEGVRDVQEQGRVGREGLETDEGGHYIGARFNGSPEGLNLFPQDMNLNRGQWKSMENEWDRALHEGKEVETVIHSIYEGEDRRPMGLDVLYTVDGVTHQRSFVNAPKGQIF